MFAISLLALDLSRIKRFAHGYADMEVAIVVKMDLLMKAFQGNDDIVRKELLLNEKSINLFYMNSLTEQKTLEEWVIRPLQLHHGEEWKGLQNVYISGESIDSVSDAVQAVLEGFTLITDGEELIKLKTYSVSQRSIESSAIESSIMGPQDSFNESLQTNLSLLKRKVKNISLKTIIGNIGEETQTQYAVLYMDNKVSRDNLNFLLRALDQMNIQGITSASVLQQMIEEMPWSPFPQLLNTVRVDTSMSSLLEGKIVLLLDGAPQALIGPITFMELVNSADDEYNRSLTATLIRHLSLFGFFMTIFITSSYVSFLTFHPEMLPPQLFSLIATSREKVPFSPMLEVLILEIIIEILREAAARMSIKVGQTIGVVGGIVIGTAAVEAGLFSNIIIILVAVSTLLSFLPTNVLLRNGFQVIKYAFILLAGMLGLFGQMIGFAYLLSHLVKLKSLGSPLLSTGFNRGRGYSNKGVLRVPERGLIKNSSRTNR
ncbi:MULTISPECIES: spore germination protein [Peribacillus]|uniref:Spore germination protein n=2 Tax=Peribacillus TaxID=2675229 RepID=A0AAW9NBV1_9BACI|nr:spore germination protein [Peribacillus frigoritolerans]MEC0272742.1 spore germination protein [Peribacillus castrilensis]TFH60007.1 spore germination protein [Peribacillus frigoritolerans]